MSSMETALIVVPDDVVRDIYVNDCLSRGVVIAYSEKHGVIRNLRIGMSILDKVVFPVDSSTYGSELLITRLWGADDYVAIDILKKSDSYSNIVENVHSIGGSKSRIILDDKTGNMVHISESAITNRIGKDAVDELNVKGKIIRHSNFVEYIIKNEYALHIEKSDGKRVSIYYNTNGLKYEDYNGNIICIKDTEIEIIGKKDIKLGDGSDYALLGNVTKDFLDRVLTQISSILVTTALGSMPILNKVQVEALKKDLNSLVSKYLKVQ